jgi:hypothetical protein
LLWYNEYRSIGHSTVVEPSIIYCIMMFLYIIRDYLIESIGTVLQVFYFTVTTMTVVTEEVFCFPNQTDVHTFVIHCWKHYLLYLIWRVIQHLDMASSKIWARTVHSFSWISVNC